MVSFCTIGDYSGKGKDKAKGERGEEEEERREEAGTIWTKSARDLVEKSKEEEYDQYFKDMLL